MNFFQRIYYSIIKHPTRSILLLLSSFIIALFVSSSYSIYLSCDHLNTIIKEQIGAKVYIPSLKLGVTYNKNSTEYQQETIPELQAVEKMKVLLKDEDVNYGEVFQTFEGFYPEGNYIPNFDHTGYLNSKFISVNHLPLVDVLENEIEIIEGRSFYEDEMNMGKPVVLVSTNVLHEDGSNLKTNEKLKLTYDVKKTFFEEDGSVTEKVIHQEVFGFDIVGIYKNKEVIKSTKLRTDGSNIQNNYTEYYIPYETLKQIGDHINKLESVYGDDNNSCGDARFMAAYFKLTNPDDLENFVQKVKKELSIYGDYRVFSSLDDYYAVADPIQRLHLISLIVIILAIIASVILLSLIISWNVKSRQKEVGLYLSLGEKRKKVFLQVFCEIWLICMLGLGLSIVIGNQVGNTLTQNMMSDAITEESIISKEEINEKMNVSMDTVYIGMMVCMGTVVLFISSISASRKMLTYSPKELLS